MNRLKSSEAIASCVAFPKEIRDAFKSGKYTFKRCPVSEADEENEQPDCNVTYYFDILKCDVSASDNGRSLIYNVLEAVNTEDALDEVVYVNPANQSDKIIDLQITSGGPNVWVRYESKYDTMIVTGTSGTETLQIVIGMSSDMFPICDYYESEIPATYFEEN